MDDGDLRKALAEATMRYMAEGGANVIFKTQALQGLLLRVRKHTATMSLNSHQVVDGYERRIRPLFSPRYLLHQQSVRLGRDVTIRLQRALVDAEQDGIRPSKRHGEYLLHQSDDGERLDYNPGIIVQDLSPSVPSERLLEFKPKWLIPSRSTPEKSRRCRTCALREMRRADETPPGRGDSNLCPLDLLSGKSYVLKPALQTLWTVDQFRDEIDDKSDMCSNSNADLAPGSAADDMGILASTEQKNDTRIESFETEFRRKVQPLLGRLKALQAIHCHVGLQDFDAGADDDISLAMTLRDCSVFVKIEASGEKVEILDVKLADLDLKSTDRDKREKWINMERRLVEEGWYEGKMAPDIVKDEVVCWVSRTCA